MYACYINIGYLILLASFTAFKLAHIINKVQCLCVTNTIYIGLFQKKKTGRLRTWNFQGYWRACGNSRGQLKKKWNFQWCSRRKHVEFPWVFIVFDLWIYKGCHSQNFAEFPWGASLGCKGKSDKSTNSWVLFSRKAYAQPPLFLE